jgi:hypothetical protein
MATPITLEDLETKFFTKKQIQDENVRLGLARCANEKKAKSIAKLRAQLMATRVVPPPPSLLLPSDAQTEFTTFIDENIAKGGEIDWLTEREVRHMFRDWKKGHDEIKLTESDMLTYMSRMYKTTLTFHGVAVKD